MEELLQHLDALYRYARRLTRDSTAAEDLTQETMLRALRHIGRLRERPAMRTWLLRIATNLHRDHCRKLQPASATIDTEDWRPTAAERWEHCEEVTATLAALDELPERQRQVTHLVTIEQLSLTEAAQVMGISVSAAKASLSVARKTLRRRLAEIDQRLCGFSEPPGQK